jgi:hypothetical protein
MPAATTASPESLAAHYQRLIAASSPFVHSTAGDLHLLPPLTGCSESQHHAALTSLVALGVLSEYRYIDSKPQPAILAIKA